MESVNAEEKKQDEAGLIFIEGAPAVRMEGVETVTVSTNLKGVVIYGTAGKKEGESSKAGNGEDK